MSQLEAKHRQLGLTDFEFERITQLLGRAPGEVELAIFSLLWSEHCAYKHSKKLLRGLPTSGPKMVLGPGENAGAIELDDGLAVAFKVESHNHPTAVEPLQGAATGVGGILRDVFALGARPIALLDSLRFGELDSQRSRYLLEHAVAGIGQYGNSVGVPTVGGELAFEAAYEQNCLINAMCVGLCRTDSLVQSAARGAGNHLVLLGASTGRDGIGGASVLASASLAAGEDKRPSVQIGDPLEAKKLLECTLELCERRLCEAVQDLGAGGLSSSCAEMAAKGGVGIDIEVADVARREPGMEPVEVMISESQERMVCVVSPENLQQLSAICQEWEVRAQRIGEVTDTGQLRVFAHGRCVCDVPADALVDDAPLYDLEPVRPPSGFYPPPRARLNESALPTAALRALLGCPSVASKRWVYEQYDSLVGSRTVAPVQAGASATWADAAVLSLRDDDTAGGALAVTVDGNGRRVACDPYTGTVETVLEAALNLACVGARPLGVTNCLNFASPEAGPIAWQLEHSVAGLADGCGALGIPVVGGNVSLYNEAEAGPIFPTPVVGMVGALADPARAAPLGFCRPGDEIALLGPFSPSLAGSQLEKLLGRMAEELRPVDLDAACACIDGVSRMVASGELASAHDISDGGLAVAVAECCIAGGLGAAIDVAALAVRLRDHGLNFAANSVLFGEGYGGVVASAKPGTIRRLAAACGVSEPIFLGEVTSEDLQVATEGTATLWLSVDEARQLYEGALSHHLE